MVCSKFDPVSRGLAKASCDLWIFPSQDALSYQAGVPAIGTVHDLMHRYERRFPEGSLLEYRYRERHYTEMCRYALGILVDSECGKRQVIESYGIAAEKVHVLPFVPPPDMCGLPASQPLYGIEHENLKNYSLPEKFFFYPAQFWLHKNHVALLSAMALLRNRAPDIEIVFVGAKKSGYAAVRRKIKDLGLERRVHILGYVPSEHIRLLYRKARALLMPTFFGPTNIPLLEAFCLGCPAAVSRVYGMPEQAGDAALLFDPSNPANIADIMYRLWTEDSLCRELSKRGLQRIQANGQESMNRYLSSILGSICCVAY
jgi:glycosyltransferase involved in cell wall biosynthesis